jgi:hypothetical protein
MIEVLPAADTVVALRVSGRIDENDIERAIQVIEAALVREERIALYSELEISSITPRALARDLRYGLGMLRELHRFARPAVVTSQSWVRGIAHIEARIFPQLEIRVFCAGGAGGGSRVGVTADPACQGRARVTAFSPSDRDNQPECDCIRGNRTDPQ